LRLAGDVYASVIRHAVEGLPNEACGLFAGPTNGAAAGTATVFYAIRNADLSPVAFTLDPYEHIAAETDADARSLPILGVMHSHPRSAAWPSPTDVAAISRFDPMGNYVNLIVSLRDAEPVLRGFRILDGEITEVSVESEIGTGLGSTSSGR